jgi:NAD(P)-dependent dehydrogenase (short-subunit alcohol dehydrogenase family)
MMDLELGGRVAVVTGASKGIGLAVVRALAAEGAAVVAGARTVDALAGLDGVTALEVDLAQPGGSEALVAHAIERHGRLDVLVNNVGRVQLRLDGFLETIDADFEASMEINFFAALRVTRGGRRSDDPTRGGSDRQRRLRQRVLSAGRAGIDYGAAKAALLNVAKALSQELGPKGIRINSVSPGQVETELWLGDHGVAATIGAATGVDPATVRSQAMAAIATGRFSTPEEVATLVALLASPRTANVTGANYVIDGGLVKTL